MAPPVEPVEAVNDAPEPAPEGQDPEAEAAEVEEVVTETEVTEVVVDYGDGEDE